MGCWGTGVSDPGVLGVLGIEYRVQSTESTYCWKSGNDARPITPSPHHPSSPRSLAPRGGSAGCTAGVREKATRAVTASSSCSSPMTTGWRVGWVAVRCAVNHLARSQPLQVRRQEASESTCMAWGGCTSQASHAIVNSKTIIQPIARMADTPGMIPFGSSRYGFSRRSGSSLEDLATAEPIHGNERCHADNP